MPVPRIAYPPKSRPLGVYSAVTTFVLAWQRVVGQDVDVVVVVVKIVMIKVMGQDGGCESLSFVRAKWNSTLVVTLLHVNFRRSSLECSRQG